METKSNNINFFKKIYFSICKIKKYGDLLKEGLKRSAYYIMDLILICSIIYSAILTLQMKKNANGLQEYLEQNFPDLTYQENTLTSEAEKRVVLDDKLVKVNFGGQLIIDTVTDYEALIDEYKETGEPTILLTANKYVTINSQGNVATYDYSEIIKQNTEEEQTTIGKEYFVSLLSNISYSYYFFGYFIGSIIGTSIVIFAYNFIISGVIFVFCKIKKVKVKFEEIYSMGLYAHTISVLGYFIINFVPSSVVAYIQLLTLLVPIGYLAYAVYINKWAMPENLS
ncbi:MAG: DUF1189 family protein [Clostridia bacterium]